MKEEEQTTPVQIKQYACTCGTCFKYMITKKSMHVTFHSPFFK